MSPSLVGDTTRFKTLVSLYAHRSYIGLYKRFGSIRIDSANGLHGGVLVEMMNIFFKISMLN